MESYHIIGNWTSDEVDDLYDYLIDLGVIEWISGVAITKESLEEIIKIENEKAIFVIFTYNENGESFLIVAGKEDYETIRDDKNCDSFYVDKYVDFLRSNLDVLEAFFEDNK